MLYYFGDQKRDPSLENYPFWSSPGEEAQVSEPRGFLQSRQGISSGIMTGEKLIAYPYMEPPMGWSLGFRVLEEVTTH